MRGTTRLNPETHMGPSRSGEDRREHRAIVIFTITVVILRFCERDSCAVSIPSDLEVFPGSINRNDARPHFQDSLRLPT